MSLRDRIYRLMAMRDHSVHELRTKLSRKPDFDESEFETAILELNKKGLLPDEQILAERVASYLRRRGKGENWIRMQLYKKRLPVKGALDRDAEIETARRILNKIKSTYPDKESWARKLINRGFTPMTVATVLGRPNEDVL